MYRYVTCNFCNYCNYLSILSYFLIFSGYSFGYSYFIAVTVNELEYSQEYWFRRKTHTGHFAVPIE
jgi:hypothetical protein